MQTVELKSVPQTPTRSFDSLAYAKRMESVGFTRQQAETMAEEQAKLIDERLATKDDIATLRSDIQTETSSLRVEIAAHLRELELRLQSQLKDSVIKMGGMNFALGGILIAIKYFG